MAQFEIGDRIGKDAKLSVAVCAIIYGPFRDSLLLQKRSDNKQYYFMGGRVEPGESLSEAIEREVLEESGLRVWAKRVVGVGSDPHRVITYPDGNRWQVVEIDIECEAEYGLVELSLKPTTESLEFIWAQREQYGLLFAPGQTRFIKYLDGETCFK